MGQKSTTIRCGGLEEVYEAGKTVGFYTYPASAHLDGDNAAAIGAVSEQVEFKRK